MTDIPRIIQSEVIKNKQDVFWKDIDENISNLTPKNVLVISLSHDKGNENEAQLLKMLSACQLGEDDYNIIQLQEDKYMAWNKINAVLNPKAVLLVGVLPSQLGIAALFRLHVINNFGGATWIPTLSLAELEQQPSMKKDLWVNALKPFFVDNL